MPNIPGYKLLIPHKEEEIITKKKKKGKKNKQYNEIKVSNDGNESISESDQTDNDICNLTEEEQLQLAMQNSLVENEVPKPHNVIEDEVNTYKEDIKLLNEFQKPPPNSKCEQHCLGILHDLYTNCINCGFILCKKDNKQKYCPSCGILLDKDVIIKRVF